ncbi:M61 family metallopeptidase [Altererythrobacter sp. MF3-039]|uniref:M61 family metallopeptidase n=1 Tax=Altererythrobacter sp. MF3-039 TaxID=3252901 RepID=UPI00390CC7F8
MRTATTSIAFALTIALAAPATAQEPVRSSPPVVAEQGSNLPPTLDAPYPGGTMLLEVDASDPRSRAFRAKQTIPVASGTRELTLVYPKWLPGNHKASGKLSELGGIKFSVNSQPINWERDPVEVYAFHLDLPEGASEVVAEMIFTSPLRASEGRVMMTDTMLNMQFEKISLYPAGHYVRRIAVKPSLKLPAGWTAATALDGQVQSGQIVSWDVTDYEALVDSPVFAGAHHKSFDLGENVDLELFGDEAKDIETEPEQIELHRKLVDEALLAFGAKSFDKYEFLLAATDKLGGIGLEHHRSSENTLAADAFTDWEAEEYDRGLLPHELAHSWVGKFRRPDKMWTPDYHRPMQDNLLWVYEGQDMFWGMVLSARSGLQSPEMVRSEFATYAAIFTAQPGREWRSVEDTTFEPIISNRKTKPFPSLVRNEDYYIEGALVWLEADQIIRGGTNGTKGLDDFAKVFFGISPEDWGVITFDFDDIVTTLNGVYPYDWATFLDTRFRQPNQPAPLKGIEMAGYSLAWKEEMGPYLKQVYASGGVNLFYSIGVNLSSGGTVGSTLWDGPAFKAGLVNGAQIVAVNGKEYSSSRITDAVSATKDGQPLELIIKRDDNYETISIDYDGGLRYPHLVKTVSAEAGLDRLLEPLGE